ncbi:hypothetical protein HYU92_00460 [Candidatus Curtissbacteria bacterium]|nr:hypothetical protein [Candidatus Curtissbacteria bacterium]
MVNASINKQRFGKCEAFFVGSAPVPASQEAKKQPCETSDTMSELLSFGDDHPSFSMVANLNLTFAFPLG